MKTAVLRADGRLNVPVRIRRALNLEAGDPVTFVVENGRIVIRPWQPRKEKSA